MRPCLLPGVGLLVFGAPILAGGILMLVLGHSGGSIGFDVCCNEVDTSGSHTYCSSYDTVVVGEVKGFISRSQLLAAGMCPEQQPVRASRLALPLLQRRRRR